MSLLAEEVKGAEKAPAFFSQIKKKAFAKAAPTTAIEPISPS